MIAVDTNLLIYAHRGESPWHEAAFNALAEAARGEWALPWPCIHEFLSIVTNPRLFKPPTPLADALTAVEMWLDAGPTLLGETPQHWSELAALVQAGKVVGPMVHDARIAALCLQHGVTEFWTADRDFSRFPALRTRNPLVG